MNLEEPSPALQQRDGKADLVRQSEYNLASITLIFFRGETRLVIELADPGVPRLEHIQRTAVLLFVHLFR